MILRPGDRIVFFGGGGGAMRRLALLILCLLPLLLGGGAAQTDGNATVYIPSTFVPVAASAGPKRGVAMIAQMQHDRQDADLLRVGWYKDYTSCAEDGDTRHVPMIWHYRYLPLALDCLPPDYDGVLLLFGEPNSESQANIPPSWACLYTLDIQTKFPNAQLFTPSVYSHNGAGDDGWAWLEEYLAICDSVEFAGLEYHSYSADIVADVEGFRAFTDGLGYGHLPIWLSEFATCYDPRPLSAIIGDLEALPYLERYAWFANRQWDWWEWCEWWLVDDDGNLTERGHDWLVALEW